MLQLNICYKAVKIRLVGQIYFFKDFKDFLTGKTYQIPKIVLRKSFGPDELSLF
jgi:hypothetical protein